MLLEGGFFSSLYAKLNQTRKLNMQRWNWYDSWNNVWLIFVCVGFFFPWWSAARLLTLWEAWLEYEVLSKSVNVAEETYEENNLWLYLTLRFSSSSRLLFSSLFTFFFFFFSFSSIPICHSLSLSDLSCLWLVRRHVCPLQRLKQRHYSAGVRWTDSSSDRERRRWN